MTYLLDTVSCQQYLTVSKHSKTTPGSPSDPNVWNMAWFWLGTTVLLRPLHNWREKRVANRDPNFYYWLCLFPFDAGTPAQGPIRRLIMHMIGPRVVRRPSILTSSFDLSNPSRIRGSKTWSKREYSKSRDNPRFFSLPPRIVAVTSIISLLSLHRGWHLITSLSSYTVAYIQTLFQWFLQQRKPWSSPGTSSSHEPPLMPMPMPTQT